MWADSGCIMGPYTLDHTPGRWVHSAEMRVDSMIPTETMISCKKMWTQIFLLDYGILSILHLKSWANAFPTCNMEFSIFNIWNFGLDFPPRNMDLAIFHCENLSAYLSLEVLFPLYSYITIGITIVWYKIWNNFHFHKIIWGLIFIQ